MKTISKAEAYRLAQAQTILDLHKKNKLENMKFDANGKIKPTKKSFDQVAQNYSVA